MAKDLCFLRLFLHFTTSFLGRPCHGQGHFLSSFRLTHHLFTVNPYYDPIIQEKSAQFAGLRNVDACNIRQF